MLSEKHLPIAFRQGAYFDARGGSGLGLSGCRKRASSTYPYREQDQCDPHSNTRNHRFETSNIATRPLRFDIVCLSREIRPFVAIYNQHHSAPRRHHVEHLYGEFVAQYRNIDSGVTEILLTLWCRTRAIATIMNVRGYIPFGTSKADSTPSGLGINPIMTPTSLGAPHEINHQGDTMTLETILEVAPSAVERDDAPPFPTHG